MSGEVRDDGYDSENADPRQRAARRPARRVGGSDVQRGERYELELRGARVGLVEDRRGGHVL